MPLLVGLDIVDLRSGVAPRPPAAAVEDVLRAEEQGFDSAWVPLIEAGPDPLAVCAAAAAATDHIRVATGILRTWGQHPVELARTALTVAAFCGGRLTLGVGVSHRPLVERTYGHGFARPAQHFREYLAVLCSLLRHGEVDFDGQMFQAHARLDQQQARRVPVAAAAGGRRMLVAAAEFADIVITAMAGPRTLETHTIPAIDEGAARVGRASPAVAAAVSVCVTQNAELARTFIDQTLAGYSANSDYRAMLDREGVHRPSNIAIVGDEDHVRAQLQRFHELGVDEIIASVKAPSEEEEQRTRLVLGGAI